MTFERWYTSGRLHSNLYRDVGKHFFVNMYFQNYIFCLYYRFVFIRAHSMFAQPKCNTSRMAVMQPWRRLGRSSGWWRQISCWRRRLCELWAGRPVLCVCVCACPRKVGITHLVHFKPCFIWSFYLTGKCRSVLYIVKELDMIKNGHHASDEEGLGAAVKPGDAACSPEKRKRVVRVWCDGWYVGNTCHFINTINH